MDRVQRLKCGSNGRITSLKILKNSERQNMDRRRFLIFMCLVLAVAAVSWGIDQRGAQALNIGPNGYYIPDYFNTPNWANSPPLRKFVDSLPRLGPAGANNLGQYIPTRAD